MFCLATPLFRRGRKVPTEHHVTTTKGGRFRLTEGFDPTSRRTVRIARLVPLNGDRGPENDELRPLWDATVIFASGAYWSVTGIEREEIDGTEVSLRQSWAMWELPPEVCEEIQSTINVGGQASVPLTLWGRTGIPAPPPARVDPRDHGAHNLRP